MSEVLSQNEVDALLKYVENEQTAVTDDERGDEQKVTGFDFSAPSPVSKELVTRIRSVHESFLYSLVSSLSGHMRSIVEVELVGIDQMTYKEYVLSLMTPAALFTFPLTPLEGEGVIELHPTLVMAMVERLFGGDGELPTGVRELTQIEQAIMTRIIGGCLTDLEEAWSEVKRLELGLKTFERNPQFLQVLAPSDPVVLVTFEIKIEKSVGLMSICYPLMALEPVIKKVENKRSSSRVKPWKSVEGVDLLERELLGVKLTMAAELGRSVLTVREILDLEEGDIIRLDRLGEQEIEVRVEGVPKFRGRPGRSGQRRAVRITKTEGERKDVGPKDA